MQKTVDNTPTPNQDNPSFGCFSVRETHMDLIEIIDQKLENKPRGEVSLKVWKKELHFLINQINSSLGFNYYDKRRLLDTDGL